MSEPIISLYNYSQTLKIDFDSLSNLLPEESIIHPFIVSLKKHLDTVISKFDLTTTTDIIDHILYSIISKFHQNFQNVSNQISTKLNAHIGQIESKIKSIPNETKGSIKIIISKISEIKIDQYISYLEKNNRSLSKFNKYVRKEQLMKLSRPNSENGSQRGFSQKDIDQLGPVYLRLRVYKRRMASYFSIKQNLNQLKTKLSVIRNTSNQMCKSLNGSSNNRENCTKNGSSDSNNIPDIKEIEQLLFICLLLKHEYIDKLNKYGPYFRFLEQIGEHIRSLKGFCSSRFKDNLDPGFCEAVNSLQNISIDKRQLFSNMKCIKTQIDDIIPKLQLIKSLLQYRDSLKVISIWSEKLPSLLKNSVNDFLKGSETIIQTLKEASKTIETTTQEIEELKTSNSHLQRFIPSELGSELKKCIEQIPLIIKELSLYLRIVRYIVYYLQIVKCNSDNTIKEIKSKISQIIDLSSALKQLKGIYSHLIKFYYTHFRTTLLLNFYSGLIESNGKFEKQLNKINQIIYETGIFIYLIMVYYIFLYHISVIVKNMEKLKPEVIGLDRFNSNIRSIKSLVSDTITKLSDLNSNITVLESILSYITLNNLKDKITNYKNQVVVIRQIIDWLMETFGNTKSYIEKAVERLKEKGGVITEEIRKYINYLSVIILIKEMMSIPSYLIKENYQNQIFRVLSDIKKYLERIKLIMELSIKVVNSNMRSITINISILKSLIYRIESNIYDMDESVLKLECAIEGVARNFIKCTLQSTNNTINSRIGSLRVDMSNKFYEEVYGLYSLTGITIYNSLVVRLLESAKKIDNIVNVMYRSYGCFCIESFEKNNAIDPNIGDLGIKQYFFRNKTIDEIYKMKTLNDMKRLYVTDMDGNHMCMCMIIKYVFNPQMLNLICVISYELKVLSTLSRKYEKYAQPSSIQTDVVQMIIIVINLVHKICTYIESTYKSYFVVSRDPTYLKCYCTYNEDPNYYRMVTTILVISSLVENIFTMDKHKIRVSIVCLSSLISDFYMIDSQNNKSTNISNELSDIVRCLFCPLKFCTISSKLNLVSVFVASSQKVPYEDWMVKPHIINISFHDLLNFEDVLKNLQTVGHHGGFKEYIGWVMNEYRSINESNNKCNQFNNQCCALSSNIIIILSTLISFKIKGKLYPTKCDLIKQGLCSFLKSFCNCKSSECCVNVLIDPAGKICNPGNNCDELLKKCIDSCCFQECCKGGCPCSKLKECCDKLKELCCDISSQNGLCKLIDAITKCTCVKSRDGSCKKCVCCKLVIESILILQNMFRNGVWIISKNIIVSCKYLLEILDKIKKTNNSTIIIKRIVDNYMIYIKLGITLVKNNLLTHPNHDITVNPLNTAKSRNWGHDNRYEHQPTDNSFNEGYPNFLVQSFLTNSSFTHSVYLP